MAILSSRRQVLWAAALAGLRAALLAGPARAADRGGAVPPAPAVRLVLGQRQATALPLGWGYAQAGGGNIHVSQPTANVVVVTMTGAGAAAGHPCRESAAGFTFDLTQAFEVVIKDRAVRRAKLYLEGRVVGLLRGGSRGSKGAGTAEVSTPGHAAVLRGTREMLRVDLPAQAVAGGQSLSINEMRGPVCTTVGAGKYTLRQVFGLRAAHVPDPCIGLAASAEFAPAPALAPRWLSRSEPFHGASKRKFGFRVLLQVVPE